MRWSGDWEDDKIITHNWLHPEIAYYNKHIVGVSNHNDGFQFIFSDGSRTSVDQSNCDQPFKDYVIEEGQQIRKVLMQYDNYDDPFLVGLKFLDAKGKTLMAAGLHDKPTY